jgi:hypothetical protein
MHHFIGVSPGQSSIMKAFPRSAEPREGPAQVVLPIAKPAWRLDHVGALQGSLRTPKVGAASGRLGRSVLRLDPLRRRIARQSVFRDVVFEVVISSLPVLDQLSAASSTATPLEVEVKALDHAPLFAGMTVGGFG